MPLQTEEDQRKDFVTRQRHLPTKCLNASPTAIGRTSGDESGLSLTRAVRLPPARYLETHDGTFPEAKRLTISFRLELIEVGTGTSAASNKC